MPTDFRFTGQRQTQGAGLEWLYYYNARWYDPTVGRFLQADTVIPDPNKGQAYNRYAYVNNNPVRYVDPSGHDWVDAFFFVGGIVHQAVVSTISGAALGVMRPFFWTQKKDFLDNILVGGLLRAPLLLKLSRG
jgi:RHS repeat-associated protein